MSIRKNNKNYNKKASRNHNGKKNYKVNIKYIN